MRDTALEQRLRIQYTGIDTRRPSKDHIAENYFAACAAQEIPRTAYLPHSSLVYCRAALEAKFPDRIFSLDEVRTLIKEVYGVKIS